MKKSYSKPEIIFEDFTLCSNIAADCEMKVKNPSRGSCGVLMSDGTTIFTEDICIFAPVDGLWDGFCYHVPAETNNLFNS